MFPVNAAYSCYLDDFQLIRIETSMPDQGFFIVGQDHQPIHFDLLDTVHTENTYILSLRIYIPYDFTKQYYVWNRYGQKVPIQERRVLTTKQFHDQFTYDGFLGTCYQKDYTLFRLWAPVSKQVKLRIYHQQTEQILRMPYAGQGVYEICLPGDYQSAVYSYLVYQQDRWLEIHDPYAKTSLINSGKSVVVDFADTPVITDHPIDQLPIQQSIIYELHVRDFSIDPAAPFQHKGKFLALCEHEVKNMHGDPIGLDYLRQLGVTHLQLLPIYDFSSVSEYDFDQAYNWGYDPAQHTVVEGRYSTDPHNPLNRIEELKHTIQHLKSHGIGVIMDVVYNHVYNVDTHALNQLVPYYFFRLDQRGQYFNGSGCGNDFATEQPMAQKFVIDSMAHWMNVYGLNGFRIDLLGLMDLDCLCELEKALRAINPNVYLYGEGWSLAVPDSSRTMSTLSNAKQVPTVGFFNDSFRDAVKGSTFDLNVNGLAAGNPFLRDRIRDILTGHVPTLFGQASQSINYVSCHDNQTLFDRLTASTSCFSPDQIREQQMLCYAFVLLSQGIPFLHAGCEFCRTKQGLDNSYHASDSINRIDWNLLHEHQSVCRYVRNLIAVRKQYPHFHHTDQKALEKYVSITQHDELIDVTLRHPTHPQALYVLFNLTDFPKHHPYSVAPLIRQIDMTGQTPVQTTPPPQIPPHQMLLLIDSA